MSTPPVWTILLIVNLAAMVWALAREVVPTLGVGRTRDRIILQAMLVLIGGAGVLFLAVCLVVEAVIRRNARRRLHVSVARENTGAVRVALL